MALPIKNAKIAEIAELDTFYNGGKGSGNFGHSGRPGKVGGSGNGQGGGVLVEDLEKKAIDKWNETWQTSPEYEKMQKEIERLKEEETKKAGKLPEGKYEKTKKDPHGYGLTQRGYTYKSEGYGNVFGLWVSAGGGFARVATFEPGKGKVKVRYTLDGYRELRGKSFDNLDSIVKRIEKKD